MPKIEKEKKSVSTGTGWGAVVARQEEVNRIREDMDRRIPEFYLTEGESAMIQFIDSAPYCYDAHAVMGKNGRYATVPCQLSEKKHCLLCSSGSKQTWKAAFRVLDYRGSWDKNSKSFRHDKQVPKIWRVGATLAQQLRTFCEKQGRDLDDLVIEVSRSGKGTDTAYNLTRAIDKNERVVKPIEFDDSELESCEDLCSPPDDATIVSNGWA